MVGRLVDWEEAGRRLCDFRAERRTVRCEVAVEGREGWVVDVRCDWKARWDVVGRVNGNGMVGRGSFFSIKSCSGRTNLGRLVRATKSHGSKRTKKGRWSGASWRRGAARRRASAPV